MKLKIAETFMSIQGEGALTGVPMFFIRFGGCSVAECPLHPSHGGLCDENWRAKSVLSKTECLNLVAEALQNVGVDGWVCITGGEPTDQPEALKYISESIQEHGMNVNIQTSGVREVSAAWDWLTVSPKTKKLAQTYGSELKLVYTGQEFRDYKKYTDFISYQLQPLWNGNTCTNMEQTVAAIQKASAEGDQWRLSLQNHKFMGVR